MPVVVKRPMFLAALIACALVVLAFYLKTLFVIFASVILLIFIVLFTIKHRIKFTVICAAVLVVISSFISANSRIEKLNSLDGDELTAIFVVIKDSQHYDGYSMVTVSTRGTTLVPKNSKFILFYYTQEDFLSGDTFVSDFKLQSLENSKYKLMNYGNSIYAQGSVVTLEKLEATDAFYKFTGNICRYVKNTVFAFFSGDIGALLTALTIGDKSDMSSIFSYNVRSTGVSHIIVVSGLHLAIIMGSLFKLLDRLFYNRFLRSFISVLCVIIISGVCGFTMSILRAGAMYIVAGLAPIFKRENDSLNSLGTAVIFVLIGAPFAIFNISFQLSVLATLAIVWVSPFYLDLLIDKLKIKSKVIISVLGIIFGSVFATIFTMPVSIKVFGYVSVIAPLTNLLITYPVSWALSFNIAALILHSIPILSFLSPPVFLIAGVCAKYTIKIINKLAQLPITTVNMSDGAFYASILFIILLIAFIIFYDNRRHQLLISKE